MRVQRVQHVQQDSHLLVFMQDKSSNRERRKRNRNRIKKTKKTNRNKGKRERERGIKQRHSREKRKTETNTFRNSTNSTHQKCKIIHQNERENTTQIVKKDKCSCKKTECQK